MKNASTQCPPITNDLQHRQRNSQMMESHGCVLFSCLRVRAVGERLTLDFAEMLSLWLVFAWLPFISCLLHETVPTDWDTEVENSVTFGNRISVGSSLKSHLNCWVKSPGKNLLRNPKKIENSPKLTPVRSTVGKAILIDYEWEHKQ